MIKLRTMAAAFVTVLVSACSPVSLLNATIPSAGYAVHKDIAYGTDTRQKMDIYVPATASAAKPAPVIVFFYGGSWQWGSKDDYLFLGEALASKGIITVIADYRVYPQVSFPEFVKDGAASFRFTHDHIAEYNGNPDALFLSGHSAGAYIAMMLTLDKSYLKEAGVKDRWLKGTIGISGPYDFLPFTDDDIKALFSTAADKDTQPINYVTGHNPPILLATGDDDDTVLPRNSHNLTAKLREKHNQVETKIYPGVGHTGIMLSLASGFREKTTLREDIAAFIQAHSH